MVEFLLSVAAACFVLSIGFVLYVALLAGVSRYFIKKYGAAEISWWT
jgi:hypothetical protein